MRILLIYPLLSRKRAKIDENKQFWPPLGLAYLAGALEAHAHAVQIIDRDMILRKNSMDFENVDAITLDKIREFKADIVGISVTTPNMPDVFHIARLIKKSFANAMIVLGGPHVTGEPMLTLQEVPHADVIVRGEGELTIMDLASGIDYKKIKGITYRNGSDFISNEDREAIQNIDEIPMPARHLLDMKFYTRPSRFTSRNLSLRTSSIFTARGCPYRCKYCAGPFVFSGRVRFHSPERVLSEIDELISKYSVEALYFAEDMFLSSKKRAEELLGLFIDEGVNKKVKWIAQAKANIITEELLLLMRKAGCVGLEYGFESGSQRVLDLMNKRLSVEESIKAARLTRNAHLRFQANIIVGYPGEKEDDFKKTIEFIKKIQPNMVGFNIFMPLPGTASYEELKHEGRRLPRWEDVGDPEAPHINYADMPEGIFERRYFEARLKVILPLNLRNFVMDNISNPLRLMKVGLTQFRGVLIKTLRAFFRMAKIRYFKEKPKTRVLYLSYNGLLEPIVPSQVIPYLEILAGRGYEFVLVTYEKKNNLNKAGKAKLNHIKMELKSKGIEWRYLRYYRYPPFVSTIYDLFKGIIYILVLIIRKRIKIVHVRGITPGIIAIILSKIFRFKILFDMRGLLAEELVGGGLMKENGFSFTLVKRAEAHMLNIADAVTVLTRKHLESNKNLYCLNQRNIPMDVVPCCVNTRHFHSDTSKREALRQELGLENKFVLMYPGKIGTFYLISEMLDFYKSMLEYMPNAIFLILTNDNEEMLLKMAKEKCLREDKIRIIKGMEFENMPQYIRIADTGIFFINPYKKIGSCPIKMGEFLASGVPVIINPGIGDTEEIVRDNKVGVVVRGHSADSYRHAVKELLMLRGSVDNLNERCMDTARKHLSLDIGVRKYFDIYAKLT